MGGIGGRGAGFRVPQAVTSPPNPPSAPRAPRRPRKPVRPAVFVSSRPDKNLNRPSSGYTSSAWPETAKKTGTWNSASSDWSRPGTSAPNLERSSDKGARCAERTAKERGKGVGRLLRRLATKGVTQPPQTPNPPQGEGNEPQRAPDLVADGGDEKVVEDGPSVSSSSEPRRKPCLSQTPRKQFRRSSPRLFLTIQTLFGKEPAFIPEME